MPDLSPDCRHQPDAAADPNGSAVFAMGANPVDSLPGIGPQRAALLASLGILTLQDLLCHFPRTYRDYSQITAAAGVAEDALVTVTGRVVRAKNIRLRGHQSLAHVVIADNSGEIGASFFGRGFLAGTVFKPGTLLTLTGTAGKYNGVCLKNPEYEVMEEEDAALIHTGRIVPVYRLCDGLTQRMMRRWIRDTLDALPPAFPDMLPAEIMRHFSLPSRRDAMECVHFPPSMESAALGRRHFIIEELFLLQCRLLHLRGLRRSGGLGVKHTLNGPFLKNLAGLLPFSLTRSQEKAVSEILGDMCSNNPMLRLLQGDVGCGKTVVAAHAVAACADSGCQTALMAPTEILAAQHAATLRALLEPLGLRVEVLTGSTPKSARLRRDIAAGAVHVVAGTHALIQENTLFDRLGLVVIDEQHRFGVVQRGALAAKGKHPDILQMTATPIPRTLALSLYGDMDVSVIDELPPGRMPVKTRVVPAAKLADMHRYIREQAELGMQAYIICPLVEESARRAEITPVIRHFQELSAGPLSGVDTALLHGRLPAAEKEEIMRRFRDGNVAVLFATTVVEVGVDAPNATIIVIENAGSFGLTQLHQLRGRVGRGSRQSYCFLTGDKNTPEGRERLAVLCRHSSGFDIAEEDLRLRGPGEVFGLQQSGMDNALLADLLGDVRLLQETRSLAADYLLNNPDYYDNITEHIARAGHTRRLATMDFFENVAPSLL